MSEHDVQRVDERSHGVASTCTTCTCGKRFEGSNPAAALAKHHTHHAIEAARTALGGEADRNG